MTQLLPPRTTGLTTLEPPKQWTYTPPPARSEGAPVDVGRLLGMMRRRWWLVVLVTIGAGALAWNEARQEPVVYRATAVIQLVDARGELTGGLVNDDVHGATYYDRTALSEAEVITSRAVAAEVVDSEPLGTRVQTIGFAARLLSDVMVPDSARPIRVPVTFTEQGTILGTAGAPVPYGTPIPIGDARATIARPHLPLAAGEILVLPRDVAADLLRAALDASPRKQTNIITVSYTSDDPVLARRIVNRTVTAYQSANARLAQQQSRRRRQFVEEQLARNDAQLADAERALSTFRGRQESYSARDRFTVQQNGLLDVEMKRQDLVAERQLVSAVVRKMGSDDATTRRDAFRMLASMQSFALNPVVSQLNGQLVTYETQRAELTSGPTGRTETNPEVLRLDTLIAQREQEVMRAASAQVALLDARIASLDELRARKVGAMQSYPAAEAEETHLAQNAQALRDQATLLRNEYQQARIAEAAEVGEVEIVDLATGARPLPTTGPRIIAIALIFGFIAGALLVILIESLNRTVKARGEIESATHLPVLATIPRTDAMKPAKAKKVFARIATSPKQADQLQRQSVALATASQWRSPTAEAFRHLRTGVFHTRNGARPRQVVITSPGEGEGKTSVAANLAITLAVQRMRVLLVDCDLYKSRMATVFDLPQGPGLCEVILENVDPHDALYPTQVSGLYAMPAGTAPVTPEDTIGSAKMTVLLNELAREFDVIILDCPPVLALPDSAILSAGADAVVLVVRAGRSKRAELGEAIRELSTVGARLAGVVLNDPDGQVPKDGGYYYAYARG
ncbi:MAG: polysaccharide biosynthesis tyrosine autokinase [Gemmatimonadaceae bacterium]|nr:polysaccharide biosynthesis tyrosine autokinase [Gemmatimonadaceae bacterium]